MALTNEQILVSALFIAGIWIAAIYSLYKSKKDAGAMNVQRMRR